MFQTEPILFLQALAVPWLTWLMAQVSGMGQVQFYVVVTGVLMFGVDLRRGFALAQLLLWTNLLTDVAKGSFAYPRPTDVDAAVVDPRTGAANRTPWLARGAPGFLAALDGEVLAWFRALPDRSFGFPSGHVSTTIALWGGLTAVFARRWLLACTLIAAPLMALSRMYLGRHFLADVLGGAVLGALLVTGGRALLLAEGAPVPLLRAERLAGVAAPRLRAIVLWVVVAPLGLIALGGIVDRQRVGTLLGLGLGYLALALRGLPAEAPGWPRALARVALAGALGYAAATAAGWAAGLASPAAATAPGRVALGAAPAFVMVWCTVTAGRRLGLYRSP